MIKAAKKRGYVTYERSTPCCRPEVTSEQIEDIMAMLSEMGINVVETEEAEADGETEKAPTNTTTMRPKAAKWSRQPEVAGQVRSKEPSERTDDPVRMYLREMGSVELLSREGEIAIAKRIEAGREAMIAGLCESPLTFQAVIIWRDELNDGKVFLRDIIDLEATYAGPDAKQMRAAGDRSRRQADGAAACPVPRRFPAAPHAGGADVAPPAAPPAATPFKAPGEPAAEGEEKATKPPPKAITTKTTWRIRCRSPPSRPSSSRKWSRPSTTSPTRSSACAACRSRTSRSA